MLPNQRPKMDENISFRDLVSRLSVKNQLGRSKRHTYLFFFITVCLMGSKTISIHAERLQISDARRKQNEEI